ncbi:alpha/beta hydrolase [Amnibacterium sp. CER49]|uniref:alpha/beta hydrolase n=1 Tax=Amnibacterium sp. CER49 TaxID=3039161 RepID=UPI00244A4027|nr:alpha/beta hydrolase [Amnibacterium sp. CER49]MDH2443447.1 alpha/beta hydrolase [Amnibacterium sp. CER49]
MSRPVILVHGLWHQPEHLAPLVEALADAGVQATAPRLHRGSFEADAAAVQEAVDAAEAAPVLVGHSYGGAVVTDVEGAAHLVYLAAFVPDVGETTASLNGRDGLINAALRVRDDGATEVRPELADQHLYADCTPQQRARARALLVPQASQYRHGSPTRTGWRTTPSTYILCTEDRAVAPATQRRMAERCTSVVELPASHSAYLSRTEEVARIIAEAAEV